MRSDLRAQRRFLPRERGRSFHVEGPALGSKDGTFDSLGFVAERTFIFASAEPHHVDADNNNDDDGDHVITTKTMITTITIL